MTKMVKILLMQETSDDYYSQKLIRDSISDWEEVSDEDFQFLHKHLHSIFPYSNGFTPMLMVKDDKPLVARIAQIKQVLDREKAKQDAERAKREEAKRAREKAKMLRKMASERELFEELSKKFKVDE